MKLGRVATLLACSGACALVYQVAWFRELRLVFGASTAASSAVLAVFMGGLGLGGARLGRRADAAKNPLALYANLEIAVACFAAASPFLVLAANAAYTASGGKTALGGLVATLFRLLLSVLVLGPTTFLMGGTLPAAAAAVERSDDVDRRRIAVLYGVNTFGAVVGALLANFLLLEVLGTRLTLWVAALVNILVGLVARMLARGRVRKTEAAVTDDAEPAVRAAWFPPAAAALAGFAFLLMELVWYRMLGPLLGGSSYTFGLILAVALAGIGIGGALYARAKSGGATLRAFAITCGLEALFVALPYAAGDKFALAVAILRPFNRLGFGTSVALWSLVSASAILPAAIVSGYQFPLVIGLYGRGVKAIGHDVGAAYLANTLGAIVGALVGGFVLVPQLGAPHCWLLVVLALVLGAAAAIVLDARQGQTRVRILGAALPAATVLVVMLFARGPTALWRHSGIGAGRAEQDIEPVDALALASFESRWARNIRWEEEGVESTVALNQGNGYTFVVNGKSDGAAIGDAPTQVMGGLAGALIHPNPKSALVVGLGTGSTAGWLGKVPSMDRVDVVELEPSILRVARDCAPINQNVVENPKVHIELADAREVLTTTRRRYDIVFSEPSNPYRAGISSLYTVEFYRAAAERLEEGGLFLQWLQTYEVDGWAVATALRTLHAVFPEVTVWQTMAGDFLLVARRAPAPVDVDRIRERLKTEPYASALRGAWRTDTAEGVLSHVVAGSGLVDVLARSDQGAVNRDDQNLLEFAFARTVGRARLRVGSDYIELARRLHLDRVDVVGKVDWDRVVEEGWLLQAMTPNADFSPPLLTRVDLPLASVLEPYHAGRFNDARTALLALERMPRSFSETALVSEIVGQAGLIDEMPLIDRHPITSEREIARAFLHAHTHNPEGAAEDLARAFVSARTDPWTPHQLLVAAFTLALDLARGNAKIARALWEAVRQPFALEAWRDDRLVLSTRLAFAAHDLPACLESVNQLEPPPPDRTVLEARAACFTKANDPRATAALADLAAFDQANSPFGVSLGKETAVVGK